MVVNGLYTIIFSILGWILPLLPDVTWSVDSGALSTFVDVIESVCYLLPMGHVAAMFGIIVALMTFRIIVALVRTIWDVLPLV